MRWSAWATIAMFAAANTVIFQKQAVDEMGWQRATLIDLAFGVVFIAAFCLYGDTGSVMMPSVTRRGVLYAALAGLAGATAFVCSNVAMSKVDASYVIPLMAAAPAVSMFIAVMFLGERVSHQQVGGAALALLGAYAVAICK